MKDYRKINSAVVTGPTGAIGMALCKLLAEKNIEVYAIVNPESHRASQLCGLDVHVVGCDLSKFTELPFMTGGKKADAFFHLAWKKTVGDGRNDMDSQIKNIQHTIEACRAAKELGCSVFIGAGSQAEYGRVNAALKPHTPCFPENGYGMAKLCAGQMSRVECEKMGIDHIWPRILSIYGPYDGVNSVVMNTIENLLRGEEPALTGGEQVWDFLYSDDAAEALYKMAVFGKNKATYPLGSGNSKKLKEYLSTIRDVIDPSLPLGFGDIPYGEKQVMHLEADISTLKKDTGFEPRVDFETGIRKTISYVRETLL